MQHAYVTKRVAPRGYVAVTRKLAQVLYDEGYPLTICGNNVNTFHVFGGWHLGYTLKKDRHNDNTFDDILNSWKHYLERELGTYPVFYVKQEIINNMDLSILHERGTT